jgi:hypothetical protein
LNTFRERFTEAFKSFAIFVVGGFIEPININVGLLLRFFWSRFGMTGTFVAFGVNTHGHSAMHVFENALRKRIAEALELGWLVEPVDVNVRLIFRLRDLLTHIMAHAFISIFSEAHRLDT